MAFSLARTRGQLIGEEVIHPTYGSRASIAYFSALTTGW